MLSNSSGLESIRNELTAVYSLPFIKSIASFAGIIVNNENSSIKLTNYEFDNVHAATIPNLDSKAEPTKSDYLNLDIVLHIIFALKWDLYYNSLVPVVMANKLVSLGENFVFS